MTLSSVGACDDDDDDDIEMMPALSAYSFPFSTVFFKISLRTVNDFVGRLMLDNNDDDDDDDESGDRLALSGMRKSSPLCISALAFNASSGIWSTGMSKSDVGLPPEIG